MPLPGPHWQVELFAATRSVVFRAAVGVLFGERLFQCVPGGAEQLERTFFRFEEAFELAASPVPHALQGGFTAARADLLQWVGLACAREGFERTTAGQLVIK